MGSFRAAGQGIELDPSFKGDAATYSQLTSLQKDASAWRRQYRQNPAAACNGTPASLCSAIPGTRQYWQLVLAVTASSFDARINMRPKVGRFNPVGPVVDQLPCHSCAAFVATAGAAAAVATVLGRSGREVLLSTQELQYCGPNSNRTCNDNWNIRAAVAELADRTLVKEACLPYTMVPDIGAAERCNYTCKDQDVLAAQGEFSYTSLTGVLPVQQHLRQYGSVITRCDVFEDFKPFFSANKQGVYPGPATGVAPVQGHCTLLVGYNNTGRFWIARNSWGTDFADGGFFKVRQYCVVMTLNQGMCSAPQVGLLG
jgi:C1A family cysteine protease